ncbi:IS30 family transposase, partial [Bacillota bacterium HCP28S3_F12]
NSYRRASLGNKSPYEMFAFMYGEEILKKLGLKLIPPDKINLSPELLK